MYTRRSFIKTASVNTAGLLADRMTTAITKANDPLTIDILETASKLGVTNYRMGWFDYDQSISGKQNLKTYNKELFIFENLNKKLSLKAAYQNHAGEIASLYFNKKAKSHLDYIPKQESTLNIAPALQRA